MTSRISRTKGPIGFRTGFDDAVTRNTTTPIAVTNPFLAAEPITDALNFHKTLYIY